VAECLAKLSVSVRALVRLIRAVRTRGVPHFEAASGVPNPYGAFGVSVDSGCIIPLPTSSTQHSNVDMLGAS
jgi:hypothetical protein